MVNNLETLRKRREEADAEYSHQLRALVVQLREENPMWTLQAIANIVNLTRERVRQILKEEGAVTRAVEESVEESVEEGMVALTCDACGKEFQRDPATHRYNQKVGLQNTYCSQGCATDALVKYQKNRKATRTHCKRGHENIPENQYPSGRCKFCQSIISKAHYAKQKEEAMNSDNHATE